MLSETYDCQNSIEALMNEFRDKYLGRDVIFRNGHFMGRTGRIIRILLIDDLIQIQAYPFRKNGKGYRDEFITSHPDAVRFYLPHALELIDPVTDQAEDAEDGKS